MKRPLLKPLPLMGRGWGGVIPQHTQCCGASPHPTSSPTQPSPLKGEGVTSGIAAVLATVPDPEIPVLSIADLGIVRAVTPDVVTITPTYTGCPATQVIERDIRDALSAAGYRSVRIETVLSPPWTTDWITDEDARS